MTKRPHSLRCETCNHFQTRFEYGNKKVCTKIRERFSNSYQIGLPLYTEIVGCASHSSHPAPTTPSAPTDEQCWICSAAIYNQMLEDTRAKIKWVRTSPTFEIMMERLLEWSTEVKDSLRREVPE